MVVAPPGTRDVSEERAADRDPAGTSRLVVDAQGPQEEGFGPVELRESQTLRLQRLYPRSIVKPAVSTILVPKPMTRPVAGQPLRDKEVLAWAGEVIGSVVVDNVGQAARVATAGA